MHDRWQEQMKRVKRYFERFERLNVGMVHSSPSEHYADDVLAFFQNCYHLKDHLKNDPAFTKHTGEEIEAFVSETPALALCADLCNATKHLILLRPPRSGHSPTFEGRHISLHLTDSFVGADKPAEPVSISMHFRVDARGGMVDAFAIAEDALRAWESFVL